MKPHRWLWPLSVPYGVAVGVRNRLYDLNVLVSYSVDAPVISVGNLSSGGTGKTPFVLFVAERLHALAPGGDFKPAVISRGYGRSTKGQVVVSDGRRVLSDPFSAGDEPFLMAESARGLVVIVDEDRVRGAATAIKDFKAKAVLLDDGFQHRRLRRDVDIVLLNGRNPLGTGLLLPAGFLREPPKSLQRSDLVVLSKSVGSDDELADRCSRMYALTGRPVMATRFWPQHWRRVGKSEVEALEKIEGRRVVAFAGIADPGSFFEMVEGMGAEVVARVPLPDHCNYSKFYLDKIARLFSANRAAWLVTTTKDAVKLPPILRLLPAYHLVVAHQAASGIAELDRLLIAALDDRQLRTK